MLEIRPGRRLQIAVHESSVNHPTIFFVHGLGGRGYQWRQQIWHLRGQYNLIVPDLLGQGESERPQPENNETYSFKALSEDLQVIFERFKGKQNFVFGHSYGGALSSFLAWKNPQTVEKLVLISPVNCEPFKSVPLMYCLPVPLLYLMRDYLDQSFEKMAFLSKDDPELLRVEKEGRDRNDLAVIKALLLGMQKIPALDPRQISTQSLIIGGAHDKVIPLKSMKNYYSGLPRGSLHMIDRAAHMPHLEQSAEVNQLLDAFLQQAK